MDLNLRHWHKIGSEPSESTFPPECCVQRFGVEADLIDQEAAAARKAAVSEEARRIVLSSIEAMEAYRRGATSVLDEPSNRLVNSVVDQCIDAVRRSACMDAFEEYHFPPGCICYVREDPDWGDVYTRPNGQACPVHDGGCICPMVDSSTYTDPDATMPGYDSRCGVHGGK